MQGVQRSAVTGEEPRARVAAVTGGASGVGRSVAEHLARQGRRVAVLDLDGDAASEVAGDLRQAGAVVSAHEVDVSSRAAVDDALDGVRGVHGPIDILVTSAALSGFVPFEDITQQEWERSLAVNVTGTFNCIQAAVPDMVASGWGRIVTISSAAGQTGSRRQGHYAASKGAVIALTKTVALEYAGKGITANTVPPFIVDTPMLRGAHDAGFLPAPEVLARMVPAGRLGHVDDLGAVCAFLCSEAAGYVTGQVIGVNGGAVT